MSIQQEFLAAVGTRRGVAAADRLCEACVGVLGVDGAALSLILGSATTGTVGASGAPARLFDELQFTYGEGPCLDAVTHRIPILVPDLADPKEVRWPGYRPAMLTHDIRGVHALPVIVGGQYCGALDLFRADPGALSTPALTGALIAADLAELPVLDILGDYLRAEAADPDDGDPWAELSTLSRPEVSQATGMLMAQLGVSAAEALVRLRAHAYATDRTAIDVAATSSPTDSAWKPTNGRHGPRNPGAGRGGHPVDSLLDDFDVVELLTELTERCTDLLDVASAGLLLADPGRRQLHLMAATSQKTHALELFQVQAEEGPCLDCYTIGEPVSVADLSGAAARWPRFVTAATTAGFTSVHAVPMRAAGITVGALGLFGTQIGDLGDADLLVAQTLAHVAAVAILQEHPPTSVTVPGQLRSALISRVLVEQAKGYLRGHLGVSVDDAFTLLRGYAREHGEHLTEVARRVLNDPDARPPILTALRAATTPPT